MRKFNEICKELDDKEAQKLLEESYNDDCGYAALYL